MGRARQNHHNASANIINGGSERAECDTHLGDGTGAKEQASGTAYMGVGGAGTTVRREKVVTQLRRRYHHDQRGANAKAVDRACCKKKRVRAKVGWWSSRGRTRSGRHAVSNLATILLLVLTQPC